MLSLDEPGDTLGLEELLSKEQASTCLVEEPLMSNEELEELMQASTCSNTSRKDQVVELKPTIYIKDWSIKSGILFTLILLVEPTDQDLFGERWIKVTGVPIGADREEVRLNLQFMYL
jgi:hypothetical protein